MRKDVRKPRRSILYVPGSNEKALKKSSTLDVDALIYDLEDSVAPNAKESARDSLIKIINSGVNKDKEQVVRINSLDTDIGKDDLKILDHCIPDAILIPKVNSADDVIECEKLVNNKDIKIWVMMETALSIVNAYEIAKASKTLKCFVMGTNDLSTELGIEEDLKRTALQTSFEKCMMASKAYKISILDGVFNDIRDSEGFEQECVYSHGLGFDGKTLIHPSQISICNKIFTPTPDQLEKARSIVSAFEKARKEDPEVGVIIFEGSQIEELHVAHARRILEAEKLIMEVSKDYQFEMKNYDFTAAGSDLVFEDYKIDEKINHIDGITVEEAEHMMATKLYQNNAKVHFNHFVEKGGRFGKRIVYGGHVISLTRSISFNGLSNAFKIIAINGGTHASPCFAGKTVFAWSKIIEKVPSWAEAWNRRATSLYFMGKYKKSLRDIDMVLKLESRHFGALIGKGQVYMEMKDYEKAYTSYLEASYINPMNTDTINQINKVSKLIKEKTI